MNTSASSEGMHELTIGTVFTPLKWAEFAISQFGIFDKWMKGASIFDPTMGEGNLLEALITHGLKKGIPASQLPIRQLFGVELNTCHFEAFLKKIKAVYGIEVSVGNFQNDDIFFLPSEQSYDIIFGNPPWQNFVDLPEQYKQKIKPQFFKYDLIGNAQDLLLGGSRIDIAALVVQKTVEKNLKPGGEAIFFMPLSLFLNDGANKFFRTYKVNDTPYQVDKIFDFNDANVFEGVATRHGLVHFSRNASQTFPIPFSRWENGKWADYFAKPVFHSTDPLSIVSDADEILLDDFQLILLNKNATPRQGLNTCGANDIFFFDECQPAGDGLCEVANGNGRVSLPQKFIFPLLTGKNFKDAVPQPYKWVLLPHNSNGRPLEPSQILYEKPLLNYLENHRYQLERRKGSLINAWLKRGYWWALLGVGEYNFSLFKIVWEAYGKTQFKPKIFEGKWQANQSLQAFIPAKTRAEAETILEQLLDTRIEKYLLSLKMEGTMNWAQPGKIKKLIRFEAEAPTLF